MLQSLLPEHAWENPAHSASYCRPHSTKLALTPGKPQSIPSNSWTSGGATWLCTFPTLKGPYPFLKLIVTIWQQDHYNSEIRLKGISQRSWGQRAEAGFLIRTSSVCLMALSAFPSSSLSKTPCIPLYPGAIKEHPHVPILGKGSETKIAGLCSCMNRPQFQSLLPVWLQTHSSPDR